MKRKALAALSIGLACLASIVAIGLPAFVFNTSIPTPGIAETLRIHGSVTYHQRITLPNHAMLTVQLIEINSPKAPEKTIAQTTVQPDGEVPIAFTLPIDSKSLDPDHSYRIAARITVGDTLWFVSARDEGFKATEALNAHDLVLTMVYQNTADNNVPNDVLNGQKWIVEDIFNDGIIDSSHLTINIEAEANGLPEEDGLRYRINGTGGCNHYTSSIILNESKKTVRFNPPGMTFMACAEAISAQENRFIDMLSKTRSYEFDDLGRLFLKDSNDQIIGRLVPDI